MIGWKTDFLQSLEAIWENLIKIYFVNNQMKELTWSKLAK